MILYIAIIAGLIELFFRPRLHLDLEKRLFLWVGRNKRKVIRLLIVILFPVLCHAQHDVKQTTYLKVEATVYNAVPEQCNSDPGHTATMFKLDLKNPYRHRIIAISRDLEKLGFKMNTKVCISGTGKYDGIWYIRDRMNKRYKKRIDFLINQDMGLGKWDCIIIQLV